MMGKKTPPQFTCIIAYVLYLSIIYSSDGFNLLYNCKGVALWVLQPGLGLSRLSTQASCAVWIPIFISSVSTRYENAWWWTVVKWSFFFFFFFLEKKTQNTKTTASRLNMKKYQVRFCHLRFLTLLSRCLSDDDESDLTTRFPRPRLPACYLDAPPSMCWLIFSTSLNMHVDKTSVELQWRHPVSRVYYTCISMWFHHCKCSFYWLYQY